MKPVHEWQQPDMFGGPAKTLGELAAEARIRAAGLRPGACYVDPRHGVVTLVDYVEGHGPFVRDSEGNVMGETVERLAAWAEVPR